MNIVGTSSDSIRRAVRLAFYSLEITPREHQEDACVDILEHYSRGKKYVVLDAPTGSGKSVIGAVVSAAVGYILDSYSRTSVIVTATNTLARQYESDFSRDRGFCFIYGAVNYPCELKNRVFKKPDHYTAEQCYRKSRFFYKLAETEPSVNDAPECRACEFSRSRAEKVTSNFAVTNYSYFVLDRLFIKTKSTGHDNFDRPLYVFDEAHLLNELFVNHCAIYFSRDRSRQFLRDVEFLCGEGSNMEAAYSGVFDIVLENVERLTIGNANVDKFLRMLFKFYGKMMEIAESKKNYAGSEELYDRLGVLYHKYHGLYCKIDDYFKYGFDVAVDCNALESSLTVKPVFVKECFAEIEAEHNLFMSATVDDVTLVDTLCLDPEKTALVRVPYTFNSDDKTVVIRNDSLVRVNYETLKSRETYEALATEIAAISERHSGENGVLVTTSFEMAEKLHEMLAGECSHSLVLHRRGSKLDDAVSEFSRSSGPSILVSPSLFEGVDLKGDLSRFQILTKAPFYSLADKRIRKIMKTYRSVYNAMTTMRLVQALGRSTRYKGDRSVSYFLDKNLVRTFNSRHNRWKDQFNVVRK